MTGPAPARLLRALASVRRRAFSYVLLAGTPWLLAASAVAWRLATAPAAALLGAGGLALLMLLAWRRASGFDTHWLVRQLDAGRNDLEDSSDLFFAAAGALGPLQRLQLARLQRRLGDGSLPELRVPPSRGAIAAFLLGVLCAVAALAWPARVPSTPPATAAPSDETAPPAPGVRLTAARLSVEPPPYTGLPRSSGARLDVRAVEGSRLHWRLRFDPVPAAASLVFLDGRRVPLRRSGDDWEGELRIATGTLYRIDADGQDQAPRRAPYRIDVTADQPPTLRVTTPAATLVERRPGQRTWDLVAEAGDDFGVAATATMRITLAQGSGENISFREQARTVAGTGPSRARRFATRVDLDALGLSEGDDVVVQFLVRDNRMPGPQEARSASHILRWPVAPPALATGIDGLVRTTLPAYFRSQRQIIIDAESLIARRKSLAAAAFIDRSDAIGVDQRLLRLRYGQFLGEESEGAPKRPLMPTNDAEDVAAERAEAEASDDHGHGAEDAATTAPAGFGRAGNLLAEFGHTHDESEAATLLDPETRTTLRAALDEMWQSELNLRQGRPEAALPFANRALEYIKQVQQASRIYLGRVGSQLPPVDPARRLSGKRDGIAPRPAPRPARPDDGSPAAAAWRALAGGDAAPGGEAALGELERWLRGAPEGVDDPLAVLAGVDEVRRDPACAACRRRLRGLLWPLIEPPVAAPGNRPAPDDMGSAYLDALRRSRP